MIKLRYLCREIKRHKLWDRFISGAQAAHLPAFLDRVPRHDLHRAEKSAFMRGFNAEKEAMRKAT